MSDTASTCGSCLGAGGWPSCSECGSKAPTPRDWATAPLRDPTHGLVTMAYGAPSAPIVLPPEVLPQFVLPPGIDDEIREFLSQRKPDSPTRRRVTINVRLDDNGGLCVLVSVDGVQAAEAIIDGDHVSLSVDL